MLPFNCKIQYCANVELMLDTRGTLYNNDLGTLKSNCLHRTTMAMMFMKVSKTRCFVSCFSTKPPSVGKNDRDLTPTTEKICTTMERKLSTGSLL